MIQFYLETIRRDLKIDWRGGLLIILIPSFFILMATLYPLAIGPDKDVLRIIGPGALVISALLTSLLPLSTLYREDENDGTLDILSFSEHPFSLYVLGKMSAYFITSALPMLILAPVMAQVFFLDIPVSILICALAPACLLFILIGHVIAALGVPNNGGSTGLLAVLVLPLYMPVLIFASGALDMTQTGLIENAKMPVTLLWAGVCVALPLAPLATAQILLIGRR